MKSTRRSTRATDGLCSISSPVAPSQRFFTGGSDGTAESTSLEFEFVQVTVPANKLIFRITDRMPLLLAEEAIAELPR